VFPNVANLPLRTPAVLARDGVRLSEVQPWDETTRPVGPAPADGRVYTAYERAAGRHLVDVHDHLRAELAQIFDLVAQVEAGLTDVGQARSSLNTMALRQNNWTLGTYCESYCRLVTTHHTIEDVSVFVHLRAAVNLLSDTLLSHLSYEERELVEPLARLGFQAD
jgi:hypothetical protein